MRDYWLWKFSEAEGLFGKREIRTVKDLRSRYPNISAVYPRLGLVELEELVRRVQAGEAIAAPEKTRKKGRPPRRATISDEEIRARRAEGQTFKSIAALAGVSPERVRQICSTDPN